MDSSRHIVSTTVTTFDGFLPPIPEGGGFWPLFALVYRRRPVAVKRATPGSTNDNHADLCPLPAE